MIDLKPLVAEVEAALVAARAEIGPGHDSESWRRRRAVMTACAQSLTEKFGARINDDWNGCRVRIAGISSTSTTGFEGAVCNWLAAARRRIDAASQEGRP